MQYFEAKDIEALLVDAGKLAPDASRQVRRAAVASARKVLAARELEHDAAKRADDRAREALAKAQKQVDEARAALDRTASEIDRLRGLQKGGAK